MASATDTLPYDNEILVRKQEELRNAGVEYCLSSFVDIHGVTKAKSVPIDHFVTMMNGSELYTGAAIDGLGQEPSDDELALWPDLDAITVMPWEPTVAWAPGSLKLHDDPWPMDTRNVLKRQIDRLAERGLVFNLGIEPEFFLVRRNEDGEVVPADPKNVIPRAAYDIANLLEVQPFLDQLIKYMNGLGWDVHSYDHEDANSQFELDFSYSDCMTMADRLTFLRLMTKVLARKHGFEATFMPKPYSNRTGSGGHFNMSMADAKTGENVFADPQRRSRLRRFQAGVQLHRRHSRARQGDRCRHLSDRQLLQTPRRRRVDDRLHLGTGLHLLREQQSHAHGAYPDELAACRVARRRHVGQPLSRRCNDAWRRP